MIPMREQAGREGDDIPVNVFAVVIRTLLRLPDIVLVVSTFITAFPASLISIKPSDCF